MDLKPPISEPVVAHTGGSLFVGMEKQTHGLYPEQMVSSSPTPCDKCYEVLFCWLRERRAGVVARTKAG